jgi:hypothetical protein
VNVILQLAAGGVEGVSDRDVRILVPPGRGRIAADVDVPAAGDGDVDANRVGVAPVVATLGPPDHHARGGDAAMETLEPPCFLADGCLDGI